MTKKLRPPTREDWNDISKLRFRDFDAKIIAVNVFDESIGLSSYNVRVIYSLPNGVKEITEHSIAGKWFPIEGRNRNKDIVIEEPEEIDYEEIIKELMVKNAFVSFNNVMWHTIIVYTPTQFLTLEEYFDLKRIKDMFFSFDLKTFYTFDEYLELRKKERSNDTK